jgi:flagellum-specific ATP synthase
VTTDTAPKLNIDRYIERLSSVESLVVNGKVTQVLGLVIEATCSGVSIGDMCHIHTKDGRNGMLRAEVVGFRGRKALLMPLGDMSGIGPENIVVPTHRPMDIDVGPALMGRVINSLGQPIDGRGPIECDERKSLIAAPMNPLERRRIAEPLATGIRAIDAVLTCGKGQRAGIFSGSGVGKSVLLGMVARYTSADVNVIALLGERGREVKDFIERDLGEEGLARSVVVACTSDEPALLRVKCALVATAIAEYFRDLGKDVLLMMDSITRFAMAQREIGLAVGEPPTTRGYPPSVFALLPRVLERAGTSRTGSITGIYTVLVEADDMTDPVGDHVRSILDGHIVLSRDLAERNHYPAVDVLASVSRVMVDVADDTHQHSSRKLRSVLATYADAEDLINIGAYVDGSNPRIDYAKGKIDDINAFLQQDVGERAEFADSVDRLHTTFAGKLN